MISRPTTSQEMDLSFFPCQRCIIIATALSLRNFRNSLGAPALAHAYIYLSLYFSSENQEGICLVLSTVKKPILSEEVLKIIYRGSA
jgi:hypothetical protein